MKRWVWLLAGFAVGCLAGPRPASEPSAPGAATPIAPASSAASAQMRPLSSASFGAWPAQQVPAAPPCTLPEDLRISTRNGRLLVNGKDLAALSPEPTPNDPLLETEGSCGDKDFHVTFELESNATSKTTLALLRHTPRRSDRVERLAFGSSPPIPVLRAVRDRASGHWVKLSMAPKHIAVRELRREQSHLKDAPTVVAERELKSAAEAYAWLRSTCGKEPCAGLILVLPAEERNAVFAAALRASAASNAPTPQIDLRNDDKADSNELALFGRLPPQAIQEVVRNAYGEFKTCYEAGLGRDAKLEGRVSVKFVIDIDGSVKSSALDSSTLPDAEVVRCIVGKFVNLHFPAPDGGVVTVVYPIMLSPG